MKVFVYGTLMCPDLRRSLGLQSYGAKQAEMLGATLYVSQGARYPFLVKTGDPNSKVKGKILQLSVIDEGGPTVLEILDQYEGLNYYRPSYIREEYNGITFYSANIGLSAMQRITHNPDNHIGGDWNGFKLEQAKVYNA